MIVAGIDPGSQRTGWGIVSELSGCLKLLEAGIIRTVGPACREMSFSGRLAHIYSELCSAFSRYRIDAAAIEQVFMAQNPASALKLGQARGVAVAACASFGLEIFDYEPTAVKSSLTGSGRAEKEQVAFMVRRLLNVRDAVWPLDTTDALAVAICHLSHARFASHIGKAVQAG